MEIRPAETDALGLQFLIANLAQPPAVVMSRNRDIKSPVHVVVHDAITNDAHSAIEDHVGSKQNAEDRYLIDTELAKGVVTLTKTPVAGPSSPHKLRGNCHGQEEQDSQGGTVRTHLRKARISDRGNILMFDKGVALELRNKAPRRAPGQLIEAERMSAIGSMACAISHDMRHSLSAIYANAEFLEQYDRSASARADLLLEIQEAVLAMTERIDSLLQFGSSGRTNPLVYERVSQVVEKAIAAVKCHPDGRKVSISVGKLPPAKADIDARNLESAIYNLLLNACQAATRSSHVPEVKVQLTEVDEGIYVTILDNGPGIPASVRRTLFDPFVTAGKSNGTGLGLTLARRIAEEHGGSVRLDESSRDRTVFTLSLTKNRLLGPISQSRIRSDRGSSIVGTPS